MTLLTALAHLIIPHTHNNHQAKLRQPKGLVTLAILAFAVPLIFKSLTPLQNGQVLGFSSSVTPQQVIELTNQERTNIGLNKLTLDDQLTAAAHEKGQDMILHNYWAHVSPSGTQPWDFISKNNYEYLYAGENLARDFSDTSSAIDAWMASPTHRENILNPNYEDIGVAVVSGTLNGTDTILVIQEFGRRRQLASSPEISPDAAPRVHTSSSKSIAPSNSGTTLSHTTSTETAAKIPQVTPFELNKSWSGAIAILFALVLLIDIIVIAKQQIHRLTGRSFAHLIFITFILIAIITTYPGLIK